MSSEGASTVRGLMAALLLLLGIAIGAAAVYLWARTAITARDGLLEAERAAAGDQVELLERTQEQWEERFKTAAGDALSRSQSSLLQAAEAKLAPIKETLLRFETQARELEQQRLRAVSSVGEQLRAVSEGQERLRAETGNLVSALRAPLVRGSWGEMQLKRVVELAGMVEYCDFRTQQSERD